MSKGMSLRSAVFAITALCGVNLNAERIVVPMKPGDITQTQQTDATRVVAESNSIVNMAHIIVSLTAGRRNAGYNRCALRQSPRRQ